MLETVPFTARIKAIPEKSARGVVERINFYEQEART
jgi:hypothetical protein